MHYLYKITNQLNGKVYIGQTVNDKKRWWAHKSFAKNPEKTGQYVHRAMAKYGIANFTYEVIAMCRTQEDADETETHLIKRYDSQNKDKGYNIAPGGDHPWNVGLPREQQPMYGKKQSEYFKQRMSEVHTGKTVIHSEEWRQQVSKALMGIPRPDNVKRKISESNKGLKRSQETRDRISQAQSGTTRSAETKAKMSSAHLGKKKSAETIKRMSEARKKFSHSQELEIVELRLSGMKLKELSAKYGCSDVTITNIVKRHK